ncbi:hypothetical protein [Kitasatospora aureofaciens]|uniref:hypothetical protein n=1 Tax=Kitasatospora aureofaciens TaxID=1894 RepID=UPI001C477E45|nr:hypothetical protein [Kitasatospora aureofaciens]MBV6702941.1 hypothetical protein [Kitasatospora aureofaciens]
MTPQKKADRALCPVVTAMTVQLRVHEVARAMRAAGVTEMLQPTTAKKWKTNPADAPDWFVALLAERAARTASRIAREKQRDFEEEHRMLILSEKVEAHLLAGNYRRIKGYDAELIAADMAFRASRELVRAHGDVCGDVDVTLLGPLDLAALAWAGVDPLNHATWEVHRGDCPII